MNFFKKKEKPPKVYVLYVGIREEDGIFKEEFTFVDGWKTHEGARSWLLMIVNFIQYLMVCHGCKGQIKQEIKVQ